MGLNITHFGKEFCRGSLYLPASKSEEGILTNHFTSLRIKFLFLTTWISVYPPMEARWQFCIIMGVLFPLFRCRDTLVRLIDKLWTLVSHMIEGIEQCQGTKRCFQRDGTGKAYKEGWSWSHVWANYSQVVSNYMLIHFLFVQLRFIEHLLDNKNCVRSIDIKSS